MQRFNLYCMSTELLNDTADRRTQSRDTVWINYTGTSEGEEFDSGTLDVEIGSGRMNPGFEDGLMERCRRKF